jgi:hypothetical protein
MRVEFEAVSDGRGVSWRFGMALAGLLCGGIAFVLVRWPWLLSYVVAALFASAGLLLLVSALAARGRRRRGPS